MISGVPQRVVAPKFSPSVATDHHVHDHAEPAWGAQGHGLIQEAAVESLPDEMPDFFTDAKDRLVGLASQPDRWKPRQLGYLRGATSVDHFLAYEQVQGQQLPKDRYDYIAMVQEKGLNVPGLPPKQTGFLPYRVAEMYQNLAVDFAYWRNEGQNLPVGDPQRAALEQNVLLSAGVLGHYIEDSSQPLHATVNHDGWHESQPNPKGFRTSKGLHRQFETQLVGAVVNEAEIKERIGPAQHWTGDPLQWGLGLIAESNSQVERLYTLEKNGELEPSHPSAEAVEFVHDRMGVGAQNLRDIWYTAWIDSEKLAPNVQPPQ